MSDISTAQADLKEFIDRPLFTLGSTDISIGRILLALILTNSEFVNGRVTNWTFDDTNRRIRIPFSAAYGTDKELVRAAGVAAARRIDEVIVEDRRAPEVWLVVAFGDSSLNFELVIWVTHPLASAPGRTHAKALWALEDELRARCWDRSRIRRRLSAATATSGRRR